MAAAPRAQDLFWDLCEETTCPVCLDYFNNPVILDCGHNFCRACLTQTWEKSGNTETSCPQCREIVSPKNLRTNQQLANIAEITKKHSTQGPKKAEGKERVCEKHQEPLNLFCKDDETFICVMCDRSKEHKDHRTIPLGTAAQNYRCSNEWYKAMAEFSASNSKENHDRTALWISYAHQKCPQKREVPVITKEEENFQVFISRCMAQANSWLLGSQAKRAKEAAEKEMEKKKK